MTTLVIFLNVNRISEPKLPSVFPSHDLPSTFLRFFNDEITRLCSSIHTTPCSPPIPPAASPPLFTNFSPASLDEVKKIILASNNSACPLDILPTWLLRSCLDALLPPITPQSLLCLSEDNSPSSFKLAFVTSLLKKANLSPDDLTN